MIRRKVKLKITTASRQTIERRALILRLYCPICEHEVEMLTRPQAAEILEIDLQTFDLLMAGGYLHTMQTVSGGIRVCQDSLFRTRR